MAGKYMDGKDFMKVLDEDCSDVNLVLLFGTEEYYIDNCIKAVKKVFLAPGSSDMDLNTIMQDSKADFAELESLIQMPPWMSQKRVIICRSQSLYNSEFGEREEEILKNIPKSCIVVFAPEKAEKNRKITKFILNNGIASEINLFPDEQLTSIIKNSLKKEDIAISDANCASLIARCESRMRLISSEIAKIKLYCAQTGKTDITFNDLEDMCPPDLNASIFTITDCFGSGKCDKALTTLNSLLIRKEPIQKLRATLITHLKRLILAKDINSRQDLAAKMKCSPYYAGKLTTQANGFTMTQLTDLFIKALKSESDVRHGVMEERASLEILIVEASVRK